MTRRTHPKSNRKSKRAKVTFFSKDDSVILSLLEETAYKMGLHIRYEPIFDQGEPWQSDGGMCRIQEERIIIINNLAPAKQKCEVILTALKQFDLDTVFVPPVVRQMLEK